MDHTGKLRLKGIDRGQLFKWDCLGYALFAGFLGLPLTSLAVTRQDETSVYGYIAGGILLSMLAILVVLCIKRIKDYRAGDPSLRPDRLYPLWYGALICGAYFAAVLLLAEDATYLSYSIRLGAEIVVGICYGCFAVMLLARFAANPWLARQFRRTLAKVKDRPATPADGVSATGPAPSVEETRTRKLQQLIKVSDRLSVQRMAQLLEMDVEALWKHVPDWAEKYHFRIAEEVLVFNKETVDAFIASLDAEFATWGQEDKRN